MTKEEDEKDREDFRKFFWSVTWRKLPPQKATEVRPYQEEAWLESRRTLREWWEEGMSEDERDFGAFRVWYCKNFNDDTHTEVEIGLMRISFLAGRRTLLEKIKSAQEESIMDLKRQISLEIAHSKQAEARIKSLEDGIEDCLSEKFEPNRIYKLRKLIEGR
jgi:hypothetical protein